MEFERYAESTKSAYVVLRQDHSAAVNISSSTDNIEDLVADLGHNKKTI